MSTRPSTPPGWNITSHAHRRMLERSIAVDELHTALLHPERTYNQYGYGPHRQVRQAGRIGVIVDAWTHHVITVVFRDRHEWLASTPPIAPQVAA